MTALQLTPIIFSIILLAAHFLRYAGPGGALLMLLLLVVLGVPRAWAARTVQVVLILGAMEWVRTIVQLAGWRSQAGEPFLRLTIILGCVVIFTLLSALLFRTAALRERYRLGRGQATTLNEDEAIMLDGDEATALDGDEATTLDGDEATALDGDRSPPRDGDQPPPAK